MQAELDRLQNRDHPAKEINKSNSNLEDSKYDKITVLPESSMVMIVDWVNGNWRPPKRPNTPSRNDSFRAKSVAPPQVVQNKSNTSCWGGQQCPPDHRALSAPPAPPRPFPRR